MRISGSLFFIMGSKTETTQQIKVKQSLRFPDHFHVITHVRIYVTRQICVGTIYTLSLSHTHITIVNEPRFTTFWRRQTNTCPAELKSNTE